MRNTIRLIKGCMVIAAFFLTQQSFSQDFTLKGNGKWHLVAKVGGRHAYLEYVYSHGTGHNPSISKGEIHFINSKNFTVQNHMTMGYGAFNQPQFALVNRGNTSDLWVKASEGVSNGVFSITNSRSATLELGSIEDDDLSDNGGTLQIYDKLPDNSHIFEGRAFFNSHNMGNGGVGIGTSDLSGHKLAVNGSIRAKEIRVETGWADFVFEDGYKVPDLKEVEGFIKQYGHLPEIPSAREIKEKGVPLGEMSSKMLQKIEELTLYIIEQHKILENQQKHIEFQNERIGNLEKYLSIE